MITDPFLYDVNAYEDFEELGIVPKGNAGQWGCLKCGKVYPRKHGAMRHYVSRHMVTEKETCRICKRHYKNLDSVQQHMRIAHGLKQSDLKHRIVPPNPRPKLE